MPKFSTVIQTFVSIVYWKYKNLDVRVFISKYFMDPRVIRSISNSGLELCKSGVHVM